MLQTADFFDKIMESAGNSAGNSAATLFGRVLTVWMEVEIDGSFLERNAAWMNSRLAYFIAAATVASILVAAWRMATTGKWEHGAELVKSLLTLALTSILTISVMIVALEITDAFSSAIIYSSLAESSDKGPATAILTAIASGAATNVVTGLLVTAFSASLNPLVVAFGGPLFFLVAIGIFAAFMLILYGIMLVRSAMLILLCATLPLSASLTNTQFGKQWFERSIGWIIAFLLFKPAAAIVFAMAFMLLDSWEDWDSFMISIFLMGSSIFILPALMRLVAPVNATTGTNAAAVVMQGTTTVATGAVLI